MYGHEIVPLGETGYGVSTTFAGRSGSSDLYPYFTFFHISDGFRQSLFTVDIEHMLHPRLLNIFEDRIAELAASRPHSSA